MPQPKKGQAEQQRTPEEVRAALEAQYESYYDDARELWEADEDGKAGRLTRALFQKLEPLLRKPTPPAYVEVIQPVQGKPYTSTGLKSTQIQYDRMNDVLGAGHWRPLFYYTQNGTLCKAIGVVGNDLEWVRVADDGEVIPYTVIAAEGMEPVIKYAEIIAQREGWGGWSSKTIGDTFKAAETNASKRMLSRFGPGSDVYRGELEDDILTALKGEAPGEQQFDRSATGRATRPQQRPPAQRPPAQRPPARAAPEPQPPEPPQEITEEQAEQELETLLAADASVEFEGETVDLKALRNEANEAMKGLPESARPSAKARFLLLNPRKDDPKQLADLVTRAKNAGGEG